MVCDVVANRARRGKVVFEATQREQGCQAGLESRGKVLFERERCMCDEIDESLESGVPGPCRPNDEWPALMFEFAQIENIRFARL